MILLVYLSQVLPVDVCINLRRRDVRVAEHLLDSAEVCTALEQMRREGVPQRVWRNGLGDSGVLDVAAEDLPCAHARERLAARVEKKHALATSLLQARSQLADVGRHGADRRPPDRNQALLAAFAEDAHQLVL